MLVCLVIKDASVSFLVNSFNNQMTQILRYAQQNTRIFSYVVRLVIFATKLEALDKSNSVSLLQQSCMGESSVRGQ